MSAIHGAARRLLTRLRVKGFAIILLLAAACGTDGSGSCDLSDYDNVTCLNGLVYYELATGCSAQAETETFHRCSAGCAVQAMSRAGAQAAPLANDLAAFCSDTRAAQVGDACDDATPCLPTRATLAADGTVTGQEYLTCGEGKCIAAAAPDVPEYLGACADDPTPYAGQTGLIVATVYDPAAPDAAAACLVATDPVTKRVASAATITCVGDWECPDGALCDDQLDQLAGGFVALGACKPGPRGVLTPDMLAPATSGAAAPAR